LGGIFSGFSAEGVGGGVENNNVIVYSLVITMPDIKPPPTPTHEPEYPVEMVPPTGYPNEGTSVMAYNDFDVATYENQGYTRRRRPVGGSRRRRVRPSRKYKKSAKRVFRKKSRSTRRR
jgi:hypothetical protein